MSTDSNAGVRVIRPHGSILQAVACKTMYGSASFYRDAAYIFHDYAQDKHLSDIIGDDWLYRWVPSVPVFISTQTGSGKNYFIGQKMIPEILMHNFKQGRNAASILILSNRIALNMQLKSEYVNIIDQYSGSRCKKYAKQFDELTDKQKNSFYNFGAVKIMSYHQLWANRDILKQEFSFVIMDECHFFVQDSPFNFSTDLMLQEIIESCEKSVRVYMSATIEEVADAILKLDRGKLIHIEQDRPFGFHTGKIYLINNKTGEGIGYFELGSHEHDDMLWHHKLYAYRDSATEQVYTPFWDKSVVIYDMERNYDYIEIETLHIEKSSKTEERYKELIDAIHAQGKDKWIVFLDSKDEGKRLEKILNDSAKEGDNFAVSVCAESKNTDNLNSHAAYMQIVNTEMFNEQVLISTSVLDNGINIKDPAVKHIVIFTLDRVKFLQMLGRVRTSRDTEVTLHLPDYQVDDVSSMLTSQMQDLVDFLAFDDMQPLEKATFINRLLSGQGWGIVGSGCGDLRYSEYAKIKCASLIASLKNMVRYFNPNWHIPMNEQTAIKTNFDNACVKYQLDVQAGRSKMVRDIRRVLTLDVSPSKKVLEIPSYWNEENDFPSIKEHLREWFLRLEEENEDAIDFMSYMYLGRYMSITERLCEVKKKMRSIRQRVWQDGISAAEDVLSQLKEDEKFLARKQNKYFSLFNQLGSFHAPSPEYSPLDMQLFWIEKDRSQIPASAMSSMKDLLQTLQKELEKIALDHGALEDLNTKEGQECNDFIKKAGFPAPGGKKAKEDMHDHPVWKAYKDVCEKSCGKQAVQLERANALLKEWNMPYKFSSLQMRDRSKATYWVVEKTE